MQKKLLSVVLFLVGSCVYADEHEQQMTKALGGQSSYETGSIVTGSSNVPSSSTSKSAYGIFGLGNAWNTNDFMEWVHTVFALSTAIDSAHTTRIKILESGVYVFLSQLFDDSGNPAAYIIRVNGDNTKVLITNVFPLHAGDYIEVFNDSTPPVSGLITIYKIADLNAPGSPVVPYNGFITD